MHIEYHIIVCVCVCVCVCIIRSAQEPTGARVKAKLNPSSKAKPF